ncbi:MAG: 50S ribosomal protein L11 [Candidatus Brennerbacteria bacterium RIFOXYC1_FULL_41_11]|uniref:Large ribosomal subunit protein uL11 n=1 Tax=Candidatus Brennerbacteria bacterium RIFOXYD1_FULL_41_16 TaxID=1797529 RepID=A0A1G1XMR3_9BACT|nr:MAG: 50S ribosomal protein L11 [Parcubacteria group bacterium GW2011_GWB1_41_4]OGY39390.1 MAG: 50S ribosomal protein L11 [Candidatus Brennerbacteria bacterium RIFOXYB1_FULL_41_13]OGY40024.1 MAG: 50S ribosomal protein L11 [Candidatus Brennerbacteria bacterium RIFOXYC1_FULL_41_11]OGY40956.1 MAG: 50S ribosomal protein L11 [Candidatus Brennerbacteria bacterium RIFOXYD1_FULL_41_16]
MAKEIKAVLKLQIQAGKATPQPPLGPALGQHGVNIGEFVKKFNDATADRGTDIIPVEITIFKDRSFEYIMKTPPVSDLLRKAVGAEKGSGVPNKKKIGKVSKKQLQEMVEKKMADMNVYDKKTAEKTIRGTARSMGVEFEE